MKYVKFGVDTHFKRGLTPKYSSDYEYEIFGVFLDEELGRKTNLFIEWASSPQDSSFSGNIVFMDKDKKNIRIYYDPVMKATEQHLLYFEQQNGHRNLQEELLMTREEFIHIIQVFELYKKNCCSEIWIKNDNGIFWVEGVR